MDSHNEETFHDAIVTTSNSDDGYQHEDFPQLEPPPQDEENEECFDEEYYDEDEEKEQKYEGKKPKTNDNSALLEMRTRLEEAILTNQLFNSKPFKHHRRRRHHHHIKKSYKTRVAHCHSVDSIDSFSSSSSSSSSSSLSTSPIHDKDIIIEEYPTLWGIPLLPSKGHPGTDIILLKFLRAREFRVSEALDMLQRTLQWRKQYNINDFTDQQQQQQEGIDATMMSSLQSCIYMGMKDRKGHPVCYNVHGVLSKDKELYNKAFGTAERRERFVRWRVELMETGIKQILMPLMNNDDDNTNVKEDDYYGMLQVIDLKDSLKPGMKELRIAIYKLLSLLQDNYPEFVVNTIFINVSLKYYAYHALFSQFITPRTTSKFIFARPNKVTKTLLRFIAPENLPVQYGGLKRENDDEFSGENEEKVSEFVIKGGGKGSIQIPVPKGGETIVWDFAVVGYEGVSYKEEFIPDDEGSYKILIQKERKVEESVRNSFYLNEPGNVIITIENKTFKKKRVFYRSKSKDTVPLYNLLGQAK